MNDRELLELAAKAAGVAFEYATEVGCVILDDRGNWVRYWNPLTDDGDALRLAVKLVIDLEWQDPYHIEAYQRSDEPHYCAEEEATMGYSIEAATRRAIVRVAAELGKAMP